jgi:hypothetical protein
MKPMRTHSVVVVRAASLIAAAVLASCGGGGGGGGGGTPPVVPSGAAAPVVAGPQSAVAGSGVVRVGFVRPANGDAFALFVGTNSTTLFAGAPVVVEPAGTAFTVGGLTNGVTYRIGIATRPSPGDPWRPSGPILSARPGAPIHVDPAASPVGADGLTPATAFPDPALALIVAAGSGGNVWLRGGDYGAVSLTVGSGVAVHGGFDAGFVLADRDPVANPSVLRGSAGQPVVDVLFGGTDAVLDGLVIDGGGVGSIGIDSQDTPLELRSLVVRDMADRGIRIRGPQSGDPLEIVLAGVDSLDNGADGLSAVGTFDAHLFASCFQGNVQEGVEFDDLFCDSGRATRLVVDGCSFAGNGTEGADVDLAASLAAVPPGGTFEIELRSSVFESNGAAGLIVDIDYETTPQWSSDIAILGCIARANRGAGMAIDLDSTQRTFVHRTRCESNLLQGLLATSFTDTGVMVVSTSYFGGNGGNGLEAALGNVPILASHCVFTGNGGVGFRSATVRSSAASNLLWLQGSATVGVDAFGSGVAGSGDLERVPLAVVRATGTNANGVVVDQVGALALGDVVELGADGVARAVVGITGSALALDPAPGAFVAPLALAVFAAPGGVDDDHTPTPASTLVGVGLASADPGPRGAPDAAEPGPVLPSGDAWLRPAVVEPVPLAALSTNDLVRVEFDRPLQGASANASTVRVRNGSGVALSAGIAVVGGALELTAPVGGWPSEVRVELDRGLVGSDGAELAAPVVIVWR